MLPDINATTSMSPNAVDKPLIFSIDSASNTASSTTSNFIYGDSPIPLRSAAAVPTTPETSSSDCSEDEQSVVALSPSCRIRKNGVLSPTTYYSGILETLPATTISSHRWEEFENPHIPTPNWGKLSFLPEHTASNVRQDTVYIPGRRRVSGTRVAAAVTNPNFRPFHNETLNQRDINKKLFYILYKKSSRTSISEPGWLYIYTSPSCPDKVKIGFTKRDPATRSQEWAGTCKLPIKRVYDKNDGPFHHGKFAEKLIQTELWNLRRKYECDRCERRPKDAGRAPVPVYHREWYEIDPESALQIVEKWRGWLATETPYDMKGELRGGWSKRYDWLADNLVAVDWNDWVKPLTTMENSVNFISRSSDTISLTWHAFKGFYFISLGVIIEMKTILACILEHPLLSLFAFLSFFVIFVWNMDRPIDLQLGAYITLPVCLVLFIRGRQRA